MFAIRLRKPKYKPSSCRKNTLFSPFMIENMHKRADQDNITNLEGAKRGIMPKACEDPNLTIT